MTIIAATASGKCVQRGLSTMRAALGYKTGLPETWEDKRYKVVDILKVLHSVFLGRKLRVWHGDMYSTKDLRSPHWEYMGDTYSTTEESDDWLMAFAYRGDDETEGHFLIGEPVCYGSSSVLILFFAVSLEVK